MIYSVSKISSPPSPKRGRAPKTESARQDPRVTRTQRALAEALIALSLERGYDAITIRDITERADIGYATFFRHYPDKDSLLLVVLEVVMEELLEVLHGAAGAERNPYEQGRALFHYVEEREAICRVLLAGPGAALLRRRMIERGTQAALMQDEPFAPQLPRDVAIHHLVSGPIELLRWWLDHDRPYPAERMASLYEALFVRPVRGER